MANLIPLVTLPQNATPLLRIYRDYAVINKSACDLIGIKSLPAFVQFRYDIDAVGRKRLYIRRTDAPSGYKLARKQKGKVGRINNRALCQLLAEYLSGYGCYRICEEMCAVDDINPEVRCYEIFFRRIS